MVGTLVLPDGYVANLEGKRNAAGRQIGSVSERETLFGFLEKPPPRLSWVSGSPEVQQSRKEYDYAHQARSQYIADIVAGNTCASLDGGFLSSSLCLLLGHGRLSPLLTNGFANDVFHKLREPGKKGLAAASTRSALVKTGCAPAIAPAVNASIITSP